MLDILVIKNKIISKGKNKKNIHPHPIYINRSKDTCDLEMALQYNDSYSEEVFTFVNNVNKSCDQWSKVLGQQYSQTIYSADLEAQLYVFKTDNFQLEIATAVGPGVVSEHLDKYGDSIGVFGLSTNKMEHTGKVLSKYKSVGQQDPMFEIYEGLIIRLDGSDLRLCDIDPII